MKETETLTITDNVVETLSISWDGTRFCEIQETKNSFPNIPNKRLIIKNPEEAKKIAKFVLNHLGFVILKTKEKDAREKESKL